MQTVSIVLPTYNEKENISLLIPQIEKLFLNEMNKKEVNKTEGNRKIFSLQEIIVVDDYSPDGTAEACRALHKKYKNIVVLQKQKQGIGAALQEGYRNAQGDVILSMDADLSFSAADIPRLLKKIEEGYDLVLGSRHMELGGYEKRQLATKIKGTISSIGNKIIRSLLKIPVHDFSGNFRAIRKTVWQDIKVQEKTNLMLLETVMQVERKGYKSAEVPVIFQERKFGKSKLHLFRESLRFLRKVWKYI